MAVPLKLTRILPEEKAQKKVSFDEETMSLSYEQHISACGYLPPNTISVKCDPEWLSIKADYEEVTPGYNLRKKHWNTIDRTVISAAKYEWIDHLMIGVKGLIKKTGRS